MVGVSPIGAEDKPVPCRYIFRSIVISSQQTLENLPRVLQEWLGLRILPVILEQAGQVVQDTLVA